MSTVTRLFAGFWRRGIQKLADKKDIRLSLIRKEKKGFTDMRTVCLPYQLAESTAASNLFMQRYATLAAVTKGLTRQRFEGITGP